ncbi:MAG: prolyl oligopeptidase family serine peptidase [Gammaproteobacteria bacterium]
MSISVADLVRYAEVGNPHDMTWRGWSGKDLGRFSPDGRYLAVVVRGGDPDRNMNESWILVYDLAVDSRSPRAREVARFTAATRYEPIGLVRWLADSRTLVFAGTRDRSVSQIYRVGVEGGPPFALTRFHEQLLWFAASADGARLIVNFRDLRAVGLSDCLGTVCRITDRYLPYLDENATEDSAGRLAVIDVVSGAESNAEAIEARDPDLDHCDIDVSLAPDGRFALQLCQLKRERIPTAWASYRAPPRLAGCVQEQNPHCVRRGFLRDLSTGKFRRVTDAPLLLFSLSVDPVWIDGGRFVILPAALEDLTADADEDAARRGHLAVLLLDPETGHVTRIGRLASDVTRATGARWDAATNTIIVEHDGLGARTQAFRRRGVLWIEVPVPTEQPTRTLALRQNLNMRPRLVLRDPRTQRETVLLDPNPWLDTRRLGRVEAVTWPVASGVWKGSLYYPPGYEPGRRYPLVIQTHGVKPGVFSLQGYSRNFPGQALTAKGVFVLQVGEDVFGQSGTPEEFPLTQAGYEAAVDYLNARGLIDPTKVGLIGWSWSGPAISFLVTHSNYAFAAAAFTDAGVHGLYGYMTESAPRAVEGEFGGPPMGSALKGWLERSPVFSLQRVRTPFLIWQAGWPGYSWDWNVGLRRAGVPVEYWYLKDGTHEVFTAEHRLVTNQRLVDWFRFWLKDEEDTDPAKSEQNARWRSFRDQQRALLGKPRPALLDWTSTPLNDPK